MSDIKDIKDLIINKVLEEGIYQLILKYSGDCKKCKCGKIIYKYNDNYKIYKNDGYYDMYLGVENISGQMNQ